MPLFCPGCTIKLLLSPYLESNRSTFLWRLYGFFFFFNLIFFFFPSIHRPNIQKWWCGNRLSMWIFTGVLQKIKLLSNILDASYFIELITFLKKNQWLKASTTFKLQGLLRKHQKIMFLYLFLAHKRIGYWISDVVMYNPQWQLFWIGSGYYKGFINTR